MSLKVGDLRALLSLDADEYFRTLDKAAEKTEQFGRQLGDLGRKMTIGLTAPLLGLGGVAVKLGADFEQAQMAFSSLMGSKSKADAFIDSLRKFAQRTPFEFTDLLKSSRLLMAFGFQAEQILPMMTSIGDAVSALGGGSYEIDRVVRALGQMRAKTKVSAEEMMQLTELGIPAWELLAKKMGKSVSEVMAETSKPGSNVDATMAIEGILEGMTARFGGMMNKQSLTFAGQLSNLKDSITAMLQDLGKALLPLAKQLLEAMQPLMDLFKQMVQELTKLSPWLEGLGAIVKNTALEFKKAHTEAAAFALKMLAIIGAAGPLIWGFGRIIQFGGKVFGWFSSLARIAFKFGQVILQVARFMMGLTWAKLVEGATNFWASITGILGPIWRLIQHLVATTKAFWELATAEGIVGALAAALVPGAIVPFLSQLALATAAIGATAGGLYFLFNKLKGGIEDWASSGKEKAKEWAAEIKKAGDVASDALKEGTPDKELGTNPAEAELAKEPPTDATAEAAAAATEDKGSKGGKGGKGGKGSPLHVEISEVGPGGPAASSAPAFAASLMRAFDPNALAIPALTEGTAAKLLGHPSAGRRFWGSAGDSMVVPTSAEAGEIRSTLKQMADTLKAIKDGQGQRPQIKTES